MISLIAAVSRNGIIGSDGALPWHLPDDFKHFKALTVGKPIIMGRKTYESIGKALPDRPNIVLTRQPTFTAEDAVVVDTMEAALAAAGDAEEIMVIGGGEVYALFLERADRIYLTRVDAIVDGDAVFPELSEEWVEVFREEHPVDERHSLSFSFCRYERNQP
ncbi:MAG: type 3 dihydrofolate reductase [Pseudomonadota bacterium]